MKKSVLGHLLLGLAIFLTSNAFAAELMSEKFRAEPFNTIDVSGAINVEIINDRSDYCLELIGDSASLSHVYVASKNGVLTLSSSAPVLAKVTTKTLNLLRYAGTGNVAGVNLTGPLNLGSNGTGTITLVGKDIELHQLNVGNAGNVHVIGINSNHLDIQDNGSGKVNLSGNMVLANLVYNGSGPLSIEWVNSSNVKVSGNGSGRVFLAGEAGLLDANIGAQTYLDAKYLHAQRAFVHTAQEARADVWTHSTLNTLATDKSTIYYYNNAPLVNSYTVTPGTVLRMTDIDADHPPLARDNCAKKCVNNC